ncbi:DddA-like double-stranded DNA deaminase toxin [Amycolatopsis sp. lyj-346]|uniref:DddA-like double-stranded DNA deaminase toxin n=1 Tax=Amycolatopsis sp. lyj-346 TaxID=2789289 RepID=UPI00397C45B3
MSVEDVARDVNAAINKLPTAALEQAGQALQDAHTALAQAVQGTGDQEVSQAVGLLAGAIADLGRINQTLTTAAQGLAGYLAKVGKVEPPPPSGSRQEPSAAKDQPASPGKLDPDKLEELRSKLPPSVPKPNPENKKTHGQWVDAQGNVHTTVSGEDQASAAAWEQLQQAGMPANRKPVITTHVEVKVAAEMIQSGQRHTELVLNNRPCVGPLGCDSLLPVLLPKGYSVTVYGPDGYEATFEGGEEW